MTYESSGSGSSEHEEPLSATAMFLRSLEEPAAPAAARDEWAAPAATPTQGPVKTGPGEFTQMFHVGSLQESVAPAASTPPQASASPAGSAAPLSPAAPANAAANAGAGTSGAPGEFTRIFYTGSGGQEAKTVVEPPPYAAPAANPASRKGFSTPGISDSASGEGSVTQIFKPAPASAPQIAGSVQAVSAAHTPMNEPLLPNPAYVPDSSRKTEPEFSAASKPGPSVTQLLSTLGNPGSSSSARSAEPVPYSPAPVPAYAPPPQQAAAATPEAGSVTQLIRRLGNAPPEPAPLPPVAPPIAQPAPASAGPGEFTRMINAGAFAPAAPAAPPPPPPTAAAPQFPAAPAFAVPHAPVPQIPQMPHAPAAPPPAMAMPQMPKPPALPAAPQIAAPKSKLEAMVPVLLILNTFLLVLVLVVVLFALKAH